MTIFNNNTSLVSYTRIEIRIVRMSVSLENDLILMCRPTGRTRGSIYMVSPVEVTRDIDPYLRGQFEIWRVKSGEVRRC